VTLGCDYLLRPELAKSFPLLVADLRRVSVSNELMIFHVVVCMDQIVLRMVDQLDGRLDVAVRGTFS